MFRFTIVAVMSLVILSGCSDTPGQEEASANDSTDWHNAYYESLGVLMDYPGSWTVSETDRGTMTFVPPGENGNAVKVRFGEYYPVWGYERCSWNRMHRKGDSFQKWARCYTADFLMNDGFTDVSTREMQKGTVQIIEAQHETDGVENLFAYFSGMSSDGSGWKQVVEVRFSAVPEKFSEYLSIVEQMISTMRTTR